MAFCSRVRERPGSSPEANTASDGVGPISGLHSVSDSLAFWSGSQWPASMPSTGQPRSCLGKALRKKLGAAKGMWGSDSLCCCRGLNRPWPHLAVQKQVTAMNLDKVPSYSLNFLFQAPETNLASGRTRTGVCQGRSHSPLWNP